jgi:cyclopropane-fatty-acyl-phospholipid synthase
MPKEKEVLEELFSLIGVTVGGRNPWDIEVHDEGFYLRALRDKNLGLGESYIDGWWDCPKLDEFMFRVVKGGLNEKVRNNLRLLLEIVPALLFNRQSKSRVREVAEKHYDLGNDLFFSFLDPYNQYSCAYFNGTDDLNAAQLNKLDLICKKIGIRSDDRVLDIGCGWGGFASYAARTRGCSVTGINISRQQIQYAKDYCQGLPVDIQQCDYRDVRGRFDKIVSVGMFEHVGAKNYRAFMSAAHRCLKDEGVFLLHTIGRNDSATTCDSWIAKYIFPNGMLPSIAQISRALEGLFMVEDLHNLGPHYDKTLMSWHDRFQRAWPTLEGRYDQRFKRMWEYYLLSCAGAFRARDIQLWQIVLTKYGTPHPNCRY